MTQNDDFVKDFLSKKQNTEKQQHESKTKTHKTKRNTLKQKKIKNKNKNLDATSVKKKKPLPFFNPFYWALALFLLPVSLLGVFAFIANKFSPLLEGGEYEWVRPTLEKNNLVDESGLSWLPVINDFYNAKTEIIIVTTIIVCVIVLIMAVLELKKGKNEK